MESIAQAIRQVLVEEKLPCASAFVIAERLGVQPLQVGEEADVLRVRLSRCQLGLFGYGAKAEGKHRRVAPMQEISRDLEQAINAALGQDGNLSCSAAWHIADDLGVPKQSVADAAEGLGVRISRCQLGAF